MSDLLTRLQAAGRSFEWVQVHTLCREYVGQLATADTEPVDWKPILRFLREHRRDDDAAMVADAVLACGVDDPLAARTLAQTLVDRGSPATARLLFDGLAQQATPGGYDWSEAKGGVARCTKDLFLATRSGPRRARYLADAYAAYRRVYDADPQLNYWHGINAAAMAARAAREGIALPGLDDGLDGGGAEAESRRLAEGIDQTLARLRPEPWIPPTQIEVDVALGRDAQALSRLEVLVADEDQTAFQLEALLRQLIQVWQLDVDSPPGTDLLPLLRAGVLRRTGGDVQLHPQELALDRVGSPAEDDPRLEKVFGRDRYVSLPWYRLGLLRCRAVARIELPLAGGQGTGFLIRAGDLGLAHDGPVVLTNAHVVPGVAHPDEAQVAFHALTEDGVATVFGIQQVLWTSPPERLDCTVLLLDGVPEGVEPVPVAPRVPTVGGRTPQRAYVIGHPQGVEVPQFSLQDNEILDHDDTLVHYRSPTEPGSSGSPVFDNQWRLIALHHAGDERMRKLHGSTGFYQANEGIRLSAIVAGIAADAGGAAGGGAAQRGGVQRGARRPSR